MLTSSPKDSSNHYMMNGWLFFVVLPMACISIFPLHMLTSSPKDSYHYMMNGWLLFVMLPMACTSVAILQGCLGIIRYRCLYGDAPLPLSPAHGVVVVKPEDNDDSSSVVATSSVGAESSVGCCCLGGRRWRNTTRLSDSDQRILDKALQEPPLRLLVIGDSLAVGVGQQHSCTPFMPEVIARTLSKSLGGRAVYWTCHGEPGASAGWIVRELERGIGSSASAAKRLSSIGDVSVADTSTSSSEDDTESDISSDEDEQDLLPTEWREWKDRLHSHRKRFDPHVLGPFDVAVVFSGANDLKSAFFPFLLTGEDVHLRKQAKERGGSYAIELRLVLDVLRDRMKEGMDGIINRFHSSKSHTRTQENHKPTYGNRQKHSSTPHEQDHCTNAPLIVLPGLPARALPIFRSLPLRWLAVPIVDKLDNHKRELAKSHIGEVMFVEPPTVTSIAEYEDQKGPLWKQRESENTLLALRDVDRGTCAQIETGMRAYYADNFENKVLNKHPSTMPQHNAPVPPLSQRPGPPGSKIFSRDGIHPTDEGYDYWARYIGSAVVEGWKKRQGM